MKYFCLFSSCIIVNGYNRCSISDIERNRNYIIPKDVAYFLKNGKISLDIVEKNFFLQEWINMFILKEIGFFTNNPEYYPSMSLVWDTPQIINNSIVEADYLSKNDLKQIINQLHILKCKYLEIRYYKKINIDSFCEIIEELKSGGIVGMTLYIPYEEDSIKDINKILYSTLILRNLIVHSSKEVDLIDDERVHFTKQVINSSTHCGVIKEFYFSITLKNFSESQHHNTCLNRKISIDKDGNIKNCPSMQQNFGNIKDTTLEEALNHPDFKKYWNVNKDMIEVCKDCEFRHICTDCRAYTERTHFDGEIDLSKPLKCGYNPYTNEWAEWSTNPLKEKAIEYYGMQDLVKKDA